MAFSWYRGASGFLAAIAVSLVVLVCQQRPPPGLLAANGGVAVPPSTGGGWNTGWNIRSFSDSGTARKDRQPAETEPLLRRHPPRPSLSDLVVNNHTLRPNASVQFLLDFAIVGFPKTATSSLLEWLSLHPQVLAHTHEIHALQHGLVGDLVTELYRLPATSSSSSVRRGYKAPRDASSPAALDLLARHWPETRLIVGLRHPVLWFESFYNFRVRKGRVMADPRSPAFVEETCPPHLTHGVCARESRFHQSLALLGKTPLATREELDLLGMSDSLPTAASLRRQPQPNPVFLYELSQLHGEKKAAADPDRFRHDLSRYLQLHPPLDPLPPADAHDLYLPNRTRAMDVCDPVFRDLRGHLMEGARNASRWIREYLLEGRGVTVSSPGEFRAALRTWEFDPCEAGIS